MPEKHEASKSRRLEAAEDTALDRQNPEVQKELEQKVDELLDNFDVNDPSHNECRVNLVQLIERSPEILRNPKVIRKIQDQVKGLLLPFAYDQALWRLDAASFFIKNFDLAKDFLQSQDCMYFFSELLREGDAYRAKSFLDVLEFTKEEMKSIVINSLDAFWGEYPYFRKSYQLSLTDRVSELQEVFELTNEQLALEAKIPNLINEALKKQESTGMFFGEIAQLISSQREVHFDIPADWHKSVSDRAYQALRDEELAQELRQTEQSSKKTVHYTMQEFRGLMRFARTLQLAIDENSLQKLLDEQVESSLRTFVLSPQFQRNISERLSVARELGLNLDEHALVGRVMDSKIASHSDEDTYYPVEVMRNAEKLGIPLFYEKFNDKCRRNIRDEILRNYTEIKGFKNVISISNNFHIPQEESLKIYKEMVSKAIREGNFDEPLFSDTQIFSWLGIEEDKFFQLEVFFDAALSFITKGIQSSSSFIDMDTCETIKKIEDILYFDETSIQKLYKEAAILLLDKGYLSDIIKIMNVARLDAEIFTIERIIKCTQYLNTKGQDWEDLLRLKENIPNGKAIFSSPEVLSVLEEKYTQWLSKDETVVSMEWKSLTLVVYDEIFRGKQNVDRAIIAYTTRKALIPGAWYADFDKIIEYFQLSDDAKKKAISQGMLSRLSLCSDGSIPTKTNRGFVQSHFHLSDRFTDYQFPIVIHECADLKDVKTIQQFLEARKEDPKFNDYISWLLDTNRESQSLTREDIGAYLPKLPLTYIEAANMKERGLALDSLESEDDYKKVFSVLKEMLDEWKDEENVASPFEAGANIFGYRLMFEYIDRPGLSHHDALHAFSSVIKLYESSGLKPNQFYGNILKQVTFDDRQYDDGTSYHYLNAIAQSLDTDYQKTFDLAKNYQEIDLLKDFFQRFQSPKQIFESWNTLKRYVDMQRIVEQATILDELKELKVLGKDKLYHYIETLAFHPSSKVDMRAVMNFWREPAVFLDNGDTHTPEEVHNRKKPSNYIEIPNLDLSGEDLRDALVEGAMDSLQVFSPMEIVYKIPLNGKETTFIAKINRKSDPDGVLAGNDTACCMPFGSGKNNVYTFNLNTALFTLQIQRPDGGIRTIAQSVLTKDRDIGIQIPTVIEQLQATDEHLSDIVSEDILLKPTSYIACDNVEVATNYKQDKYAKVIETVYRDFFKEYLARFGEEQELHKEKVIIGQGYSDALKHLPEEPNTFAPLAPVGYSDKTGENVFVLDLPENTPVLQREVKFDESYTRQKRGSLGIRGIAPLTFEDTLAVSYLEGKAYSDNESLMVFLHNNENMLMGKDINNAFKGRPNMSLKYEDDKGKLRAYMVAYEGVLADREGRSEEDEGDDEPRWDRGERVIYIEDLASDRDPAALAGPKVVRGFAELYKKLYLEKGDFIPLYAEAREKTSYKIITRNLEKLTKKLGISYEIEELPSYEVGDDVMHPVIIRPVSVE